MKLLLFKQEEIPIATGIEKLKFGFKMVLRGTITLKLQTVPHEWVYNTTLIGQDARKNQNSITGHQTAKRANR